MLTQLQHFELARRRIAAADRTFMSSKLYEATMPTFLDIARACLELAALAAIASAIAIIAIGFAPLP